MSQADRAEAQDLEACIRLVTRFYRHLDRGEFNSLDAIMARDGVYVRPGNKPVPAGNALIHELSKRPRTTTIVHLLTNLLAERVAPDTLKVSGYITVFRHDGADARRDLPPLNGPHSIRELDIRLQKREVGWQIQKVDNKLLFSAVA